MTPPLRPDWWEAMSGPVRICDLATRRWSLAARPLKALAGPIVQRQALACERRRVQARNSPAAHGGEPYGAARNSAWKRWTRWYSPIRFDGLIRKRKATP